MREELRQIKRIKNVYSEKEIRTIFVKRLDDELFLTLGKLVVTDADENEQLWRGYEVLVNFHPVSAA